MHFITYVKHILFYLFTYYSFSLSLYGHTLTHEGVVSSTLTWFISKIVFKSLKANNSMACHYFTNTCFMFYFEASIVI